jgi:hypothetical protein
MYISSSLNQMFGTARNKADIFVVKVVLCFEGL